MKKHTLLIVLFISTAFCAICQSLEKSEPFNEPINWSKVLQLKNKNTFMLEVTPKEGLNAILFDANRKIIFNGKLALTTIKDKQQQSTIGGIYEIGGDPVIFYKTYFEKTPVMIRIIIDGKTCKVKSEEKVAETSEYSMGKAYGVAFGDLLMPSVYVEKDQESDFYALIIFDSFASETKDRIEVLHFNPTHQLINRAKYRDPNNKYKYTNYLGAYVSKDEYVTMVSYAYNTKKSGGEEGRFYVAQLSKGKTDFVQKELEYKEYYKHSDCVFVYNKPLNVLDLVLINQATSKGNDETYSVGFQAVNPKTLEISKPYTPDFTEAQRYYKETMKQRGDFTPMLQGFNIDKNGNRILLYQTTTVVTSSSGFLYTMLSDVAVLTVSTQGRTTSTTFMPFSYQRAGQHGAFSYFNTNKGVKGVVYQGGFANEQYFHMQLFSTANANLLLANNTRENVEKPSSEKADLVRAISGCNAMKYTMKGNSVQKDPLFPNGLVEKGGLFCNFAASDYNAATGIYAILVIDPKTKKSHMAWMKME